MSESRAVLDRFDREMREDPPPSRGRAYERDGPVVREVSDETNIVYHRLSRDEATEVIHREMARARDRGHAIEWKVYEHDRPAGMGELLRAEGFSPDPAEQLMVRDLTLHPPRALRSGPVEVREVEVGSREAADAFRVQAAAFGPGDAQTERQFQETLEDPSVRTFLAYLEGRPVSSGRVELPAGRSFAGLWGGGTVPDARHRGAYRALVEARAARAADAGYRYLMVEARATSRPTLERVGFQPIVGVQGWRWRPGPSSPGP